MSGGDPGRGPEGAQDLAEALDEGESYGVEQCIQAVGWECEIPRSVLTGASRRPDALTARSLVVCLARDQEEPASYEQIGRGLGGRDHSTVINSERRGRQRLEQDEEFKKLYLKLRKLLLRGVEVKSKFIEPSNDRAQELIKDAIARREVSPVDVLSDKAVQGMQLIELVAALPDDSPEDPEVLGSSERARLILLTAGILPGRRVRFMSPVEKDSLYHVLETLGLLRKE